MKIADLRDALTNYGWVKERILAKVTTLDKVGADMVYVPVLGLAIVPIIKIEDNGTVAWVRVNKMMSRVWDKTENEVIDDALSNLNVRVVNLGKAFITGDIRGEDIYDDIDLNGETAVAVMGNYTNGAAAIFKYGVADRMCELFGTDEVLFVFTSIHEAMVHPGGTDAEGIRKALRYTHETEVDPEERLSEEVYAYDRNTKEFRVV